MQKLPWFDEYEACGLPLTLEPYPDGPVSGLLDQAAEKFPRSGLVQNGREFSYGLVRDHARSLAAALAGLGVKKGDRVATILPTSVQFVVADYAISMAGAAHIPSSFLEPPHVLSHKFEKGAPKVLIGLVYDEEKDLKLLKSLVHANGIQHLVLTRLSDYEDPVSSPRAENGALSFSALIAANRPEPPAISLNTSTDLETLLFTGGTTGLPKGCMLTHKNILSNAHQSAANFGPINLALNGNFSALLAIPFFHSYGHMMMHTMTLLGATQLLIPDSRDTGLIIKAIRENYPLFQFGVPTQYMKMLKEELSDVKILGVSGSAALPTRVQEEFEKKGGGGIMEGYGLSECSPNTHLNPSLTIRILGGRDRPEWKRELTRWLAVKVGAPLARRFDRRKIGEGFSKILPRIMERASAPELKTDDRKGSIGIPFHDTEIKVVDESGARLGMEELKSGKVGEMRIKGPQRMLGYWPTPGDGLDEEGFVPTGDVVKMDERGYFYIVDRKKDMIIVSGYKVYSREMDDVLLEHPAVELAATIGLPDPEREGSEKVKVVLQLKPDHKGKVTEQQIIDWLRDKVARYAVPKHVEFIDEMPLTGIQKVDKKALRIKEKAD